jgi:rod shape determining protein RodA
VKFATWKYRFHWPLLAVVTGLSLLGWIAIARGEQLAGGSGSYLHRQWIWSLLCGVAMLMATLPHYRILARWSYPAFALSLLLLTVVYLFPAVNGAQRWIRFGRVGLQPSEFAKVALVLALARYLMYRESYRRFWGLVAPLALTLVPLVLILKEPDLGTALVFLPVLFSMLFAAGARPGHLAMLVVLAVCVLPALWSQMSREQKSRVTALAEQTHAGERPSEDGYHLHQAKQMLALGAWTGSYFDKSTPEDRGAFRVPEAHTDSVSTLLAERLGLVGWSLVSVLFLLFAWRGLAVADSTREPYGRLVAVGLTALICVQAVINLGMLVGLLPITGLALPFVSYGGSSLLANSLAVGLLLNIAMRPGYEVTNEPFCFTT